MSRQNVASVDPQNLSSSPPHSPFSPAELRSPPAPPRHRLAPLGHLRPMHCCTLTALASPRPRRQVQPRGPTPPSRTLPPSPTRSPKVFTEPVFPQQRTKRTMLACETTRRLSPRGLASQHCPFCALLRKHRLREHLGRPGRAGRHRSAWRGWSSRLNLWFRPW